MLKDIYIKYVLKHYKMIILVITITLLSAFLFFVVYSVIPKKSIAKSNEVEKTLTNERPIEEVEINYYYVDIKGAVNNPGVYQLRKGSRVVDVVREAGGFVDNADTSVLNLSKKITDEMVIIIYTKDELKEYLENSQNIEEVIKITEKECNCPDPTINGACIEKEISNIERDFSDKISINKATINDLMTLPGIGESKANNIINYRLEHGQFDNIDDIKNVSGIGDSIFDKIKDFITL